MEVAARVERVDILLASRDEAQIRQGIEILRALSLSPGEIAARAAAALPDPLFPAPLLRVVDGERGWDATRLWACDCAERALPHFEVSRPHDKRPRRAIEAARTFARTPQSKTVASEYAPLHEVIGEARGASVDAATFLERMAVFAAESLGFWTDNDSTNAAFYAIQAAINTGSRVEKETARGLEIGWQRQRLAHYLTLLLTGDPL